MNNERIEKIDIFDILGKRVQSLDVKGQASFKTVSIESLKSGIYLVKTKTDKGTGVKKLVIK